MVVAQHRQGGERYRRQQEPAQHQDVLYPRPRHQHHPHPDGAEDDGRAHVRLRHDQPRRQGRQRQGGQEHPYARNLELAVGQVAGQGDDGEELGHLRGLYLCPGYGDPPPRAEGALAQEQRRHQDEDRQGVQRRRHLPEQPIVHPGDGRHHGQPEQGEHRLLGHRVAEAGDAVGVSRQGGAVDEQGAVGHQRRCQQHQRVVEVAGDAALHYCPSSGPSASLRSGF